MTELTSEQAFLWETVRSPKWIGFRHILVPGLSKHSQPVIEGFPIHSNARILDLGCGLGDTSIAWGRRVPEGYVLGVDLSPSFLKIARSEAEEAGQDQVEFLVADAGEYDFETHFDLLYSRFGCMFFDRPVEAFRHLAGALKPGGQLVLQVWRGREHNPWFTQTRPAVLEILPEREPSGPVNGPGPFAMADRESTKGMLSEAGFREIEFEIVNVDMFLGAHLEEATTFQTVNGPVGQMIREAGEQAQGKEAEIREAIAGALGPFVRPDGVFLPSSSWLVRALT